MRKIGKNFVWFDPDLVDGAEVVIDARIGVVWTEIAGVLMDVSGEVEKLLFAFDHNGFVGVLEKNADALVLFVDVHGVFGGQRAHKEVDAVGLGLFN